MREGELGCLQTGLENYRYDLSGYSKKRGLFLIRNDGIEISFTEFINKTI